MNEREMLEFAAKAAGLDGRWTKTLGGWDALVINDPWCAWQPLHDDGHAFHLAVKLNITVHQYPIYTKEKHSALAINQIDIENDISGIATYSECDGDKYAATRLAIVRCASEIGKDMP